MRLVCPQRGAGGRAYLVPNWAQGCEPEEGFFVVREPTRVGKKPLIDDALTTMASARSG